MPQEIKHHLTDALLMGYSAGTLPEAFNLVVASHVSLCDECRARLAEFDAVGGEIVAMSETAEMSADSLALTLAAISDAPAEEEQAAAPEITGTAVLPRPIREYVGGDVEAVKWRKIGGGVRQAILRTSKNATARLLYIPAGCAVPDHGHAGTELTLVLQGAFRDETDRFGAGDVEVANEDLDHQPVAEDGEDCICLAATDAPLKFNAMIPKLAQPFLRI
ncbi:ChrR family anti-sigma-E factor [Salibaculum griseiflavum]|jgi:putative transcriptional regulator|uniref:Transcriptional regulator n=1 Tax=Salibaculum griseiflavum TaxID=1914409 RepID=A0A2V1P195_9RHOB|nr:ChrR family anti-sigma-E factor [Salibaculum griseiflavum]PWG16303.1 transcriptional regulator [Salibaculum griseiflavum]